MGLFVFVLLGSFSVTSFAKTATVEIKPTQEGSTVSGTMILEEVPGGLMINAKVKGVSPGLHGFHIHETGSCEDGGKAAGGHFNPKHVSHGFLLVHGFLGAHAGDLGNQNIEADGTGELEVTLPGLSLSTGEYNVSGKSVILHENADDFGQPTGNAGGRIGCGVIPEE